MKLNVQTKNIIIEVISIAYILLFVYAAVSKLMDFSNFQIQIGQSPLLSSFAGPVSYGVPITEIGLAFLLVLPKYRLLGLYGSFFLMTMFTTYIFIILNFSSFVPCSCGGILEKMGWTEHFIFNVSFVLLAAIAIFIIVNRRVVYYLITILLTAGISSITILFLLSEDIIQHRNNFIRRYPDQVHKTLDINLNFNSYYFAGAVENKIYLGNYTAPLLLTEIDTTLKTKKEIIIHLDNLKLPFRSLELRINSNHFFAVDGTIPCLFKGKTGTWKAKSIPLKCKPFANPVILDSTTILFRTHKENGESVLGSLNFSKKEDVFLNPELLQKQIDGIFDCDGNLMYDNFTNKAVYLYRYRNQFIVFNSSLNLNLRGKTIDTISKAQIEVAYTKETEEKKLSSPPLTVNKTGVLHRGLLFVNSNLIGKYEDAKMWKQTSVIDIYDIKTNTYLVSFYVYNIDGKKLKRFYVSGNNFYALIGTHLVNYKLSNMIVKRFATNKISFKK